MNIQVDRGELKTFLLTYQNQLSDIFFQVHLKGGPFWIWGVKKLPDMEKIMQKYFQNCFLKPLGKMEQENGW